MSRYSRSTAGTKVKTLRVHSVRVFLSETEHEALRRRAGKKALSLYLREVGLGECIRSVRKNEEIAEIVQQIAKLGNNLNQIARIFNVARVEGKTIYIVRFLAGLMSIEREMKDVMQDFRKRTGKSERD